MDSSVDRASLLAFEIRGSSKTMVPARLGTVVSAAVILYLPCGPKTTNRRRAYIVMAMRPPAGTLSA